MSSEQRKLHEEARKADIAAVQEAMMQVLDTASCSDLVEGGARNELIGDLFTFLEGATEFWTGGKNEEIMIPDPDAPDFQ